MFKSEKINLKKKPYLKFFQFVSNNCIVYLPGVSWESEIFQTFPKFKTFKIKFEHLEQKLDLTNQNSSEKFFKNNAHLQEKIIILLFSSKKQIPLPENPGKNCDTARVKWTELFNRNLLKCCTISPILTLQIQMLPGQTTQLWH
jgi:hypothetical protein